MDTPFRATCPPLDRAMKCYSEVGASSCARRAGVALKTLLAGVETSLWPEVAWRFSDLTRDGFPVELGFTSTDEDIRYVCEVAGPETDASLRLERALASLKSLGSPQCSLPLLESLTALQLNSSLGYGAWVSGRHRNNTDIFKLYVEVPEWPSADLSHFVNETLGRPFVPPAQSLSLRMIGIELVTGRRELYFRAASLERWEVGRLMGHLDLSHRTAELLDLVDVVVQQPHRERFAGGQVGFSLSRREGHPHGTFSLFMIARNVLGGDAKIRQRILEVAKVRGWPMDRYAAISHPLVDRYGPRTHHQMVSFVIGSTGPPTLHIGLRPPV
ncbi:MAG: hypothetical protein MRJ68_05585 [Nitrospira sp.]|nr:hypothetical protein [Nitrospira sp.]